MKVDIAKEDYSTMLSCPYCDGENLHHETIKVYKLIDKKIKVSIFHKDLMINHNQDFSKSSRLDDAISIIFNCENCREFPVLHIYQYKGTTFINWEK